MLWTGKQLVSNVIKLVVALWGLQFKELKGLSMSSKAKVPASYMGGYEE
jgi:hypothetical protein